MNTSDQRKQFDAIAEAFRVCPDSCRTLARVLDTEYDFSNYAGALGTMARAIDSGMNLTLLIEHSSKLLELVKEYRKPTL